MLRQLDTLIRFAVVMLVISLLIIIVTARLIPGKPTPTGNSPDLFS